MDASQLKAIEDLKKLISEDHVLAVPDEAAAVEAAPADSGDPAAAPPDAPSPGQSEPPDHGDDRSLCPATVTVDCCDFRNQKTSKEKH